MYTECTVLFSSAQAHFTEANNPHAKYIWTNINASLRGVVDKTMSGLEPLRVTERNAKPTIANPKVQILRQTGVQSKHSCAAWPRTKQLHVFTHGHLPEPVLSIRTCFFTSSKRGPCTSLQTYHCSELSVCFTNLYKITEAG